MVTYSELENAKQAAVEAVRIAAEMEKQYLKETLEKVGFTGQWIRVLEKPEIVGQIKVGKDERGRYEYKFYPQKKDGTLSKKVKNVAELNKVNWNSQKAGELLKLYFYADTEETV